MCKKEKIVVRAERRLTPASLDRPSACRWSQSVRPLFEVVYSAGGWDANGHAGVNVIGNFVPTPMIVLGGLGTEVFLRGSVYWAMAIVLVILTKSRLGVDSNNTQLGN